MNKRKTSINTLFLIALILLLCIPLIQCLIAYIAIQPYESLRFKSNNPQIANPYSRYFNPSYNLRKNSVKKESEIIANHVADSLTRQTVQNIPDIVSQLKCFDLFRLRIMDSNGFLISDSCNDRDLVAEDPLNSGLIKDFEYNYDKLIITKTQKDQQYYKEAKAWEKIENRFIGFDYYDGFYYTKDYLDGKEIRTARTKKTGFAERKVLLKPDSSVLYTCVPFFSSQKIAGFVLVSYKFQYAPFTLFEWVSEFASYLYMSAFAAIILILLLRNKISKPIIKLSENTSECRIINGKILYSSQPVTNSHNEISQLADSFNSLVDRLNRNLEDIELYSHAVPHSFKNQLATIRLETEFLSQNNCPEQTVRSIEKIQNAIFKLDEYLLNLKEYNRAGLEASEDLETVPVNQFAENIISRIKNSFPETEIQYSGLPQNKEMIQLYPACFEKIFENLVENAASFGTKVHASISISSQKEKQLMHILIEDNGPGVPVQEKDKIFQFGYSHRNLEFKKKELGTGMGLAIVNKIVRNQLNGSISVSKSQILGGAAFSVEFPL